MKLRKIVSLCIIIALAIVCVTYIAPTTKASAAETKINKKKYELEVGGKFTVKLKNVPKGTTVKWYSSKKSVATVGKKTGKITAKKVGKANIYTKIGNKKYTCKITVIKNNKNDPGVVSTKADPNKANLYCADGKVVSFDTSVEVIDLNKYDYTDVSELSKCKKLKKIYFGSWPQSEIKGKNLTDAIVNANYDENGDTTVDGQKYRRLNIDMVTAYSTAWGDSNPYWAGNLKYDWSGVSSEDEMEDKYGSWWNWPLNKELYYYFIYEPIEWRVLATENNGLLILSEKGLENKMDINEGLKNIYELAFEDGAKKLIKETEVKRRANPWNEGDIDYNAKVLSTSKEKIFILSVQDIFNKNYGLYKKDMISDKYGYKDFVSNEKLLCLATDYSVAMGTVTCKLYNPSVSSEENYGYWWLATPPYGGDSLVSNVIVDKDGIIYIGGLDTSPEYASIRPAIVINLK